MENKNGISTAYEYTHQFCHAIQDVVASLQIANIAGSAAARGDHGRAKAIIFESYN